MSLVTYLRRSVTGDIFSTYGAVPSTPLRPGVNFKVAQHPPNDVVMHSATTLALLCLGDEHYLRTGRWCLSYDERRLLLEKLDTTCHENATRKTNRGGDGQLSVADFEAFCSQEQNRQWVLKHLPSSAHGLACFSLMKRAVLYFDKNSDKVLDETEWDLFLDFCAQLRLRYLQQMALVQFRAYFGRGQSGSKHTEETNGRMDSFCHVAVSADALKSLATREFEQRSRTCCRRRACCSRKSRIQIGVLVTDWKGWRSDLYYYSANVHPLHGIWACCANNRMDRDERFVMEIAVLCFCYWMAHEQEDMDHLPEWLQKKVYLDILFVTIPSIIMYYILLFLFTTPMCGTVDESSAAPSAIRRAKIISFAGDVLGNIFVLGLLVSAVIRVFLDRRESSTDHAALIYRTLKSRIMAYLIAWGQMVTIYFNPFFAWGSTEPRTTSLGDYIGLGQWSMEKCKVLMTIVVLPEARRPTWSNLAKQEIAKKLANNTRISV